MDRVAERKMLLAIHNKIKQRTVKEDVVAELVRQVEAAGPPWYELLLAVKENPVHHGY